ncbi:MAG: hypothetical protein ACYTF1_16610, partial [Planctomycetota bacterium]
MTTNVKMLKACAVVFITLLWVTIPSGAWGADVAGEGDANSNIISIESDPSEVKAKPGGEASVIIEVDGYHCGWCGVCDEYADYSCSVWGSYPGWCWPETVEFNDPIPDNMVVTQIKATVNGVRCPYEGGGGGTGEVTVLVNSMSVGSGMQQGSCVCGTCFPLTVSSPYHP